ncbi:MAG: hypothetical protein NC921_04040 [Candidatus Omnitrophica bacterium]|nr:hypothetical protein [Candidatus Omnitrophota bacterium]
MRGRELKFKSKLEKLAYDILVEIFKNTKFNIYLHYYIPTIGLEVDMAIPELSLAFEVQGEQHRDPEHFFNTRKRFKFLSQKERDKYLKEMLEINGWKLIELYPEDLTYETIYKKIMEEN